MKKLVILTLMAVLCAPAQKRDAKKDSRLRKELASAYSRWLSEDVAYIISDEEKRAFSQLRNDDEREQFVEQFWLRRDPTPDTIENEYKEEHYRRIAYANEHFASGIPGWRADRGRIYIRFGAPDEIDAHPSGGSYLRPAAEGGGETSTYPFEIWRYRHLDNVGEDVTVEFVDLTMSGEYRLTVDPCEKDALTYVPNAGLTQAEQLGLSTKNARFQNTDGTHCGAPLGGRPESYNQFNRIALAANLEKAPAVKFKDLENTLVTTRVTFNALPIHVRVDYLRVTNFSVMANVTVEFQNRDLQYQIKDGAQKAGIELLGHVYTLTRRPAATFEKSLEVIAPGGLLEQTYKERSVWQAAIPLAPGRYKLEIAGKDRLSGAIARYEAALDVPHFEESELEISSVILADSISPLPTRQIGGSLFAIGDTKVRPRVDAHFSAEEKLGIYFQLYHAAPKVRIGWEVYDKSTGRKAIDFTEEAPGGNAVRKLLPLREFAPGDYTLKIKIDDGVSRVARETAFSIVK